MAKITSVIQAQGKPSPPHACLQQAFHYACNQHADQISMFNIYVLYEYELINNQRFNTDNQKYQYRINDEG